MGDSYRQRLGMTGSVVGQAGAALKDGEGGRMKVVGKVVGAEVQTRPLRHFLPWVEKVIAQTRERLWKGNPHAPDKVLSLFEEHTQVIRKGKPDKPTEFGRLVRIDEVEHGVVSGFQVQEGNAADTQAWIPALEQHEAVFEQAPRLATGDRGFFSAENEREAKARGVEKVALPGRGRLSKTRAKRQKQRWFRRALRWRAGIEATLSNLKLSFGRARYFLRAARRAHQRSAGQALFPQSGSHWKGTHVRVPAESGRPARDRRHRGRCA